MSKITNYGLTRSSTGCLIGLAAAPMATMGVKRLSIHVRSIM